MSASLQQTFCQSSSFSSGPIFLSREEHAEKVVGTGTGPAEWRQQQERQALLEEQTAALAAAIDDLSWHVRGRLVDRLARLLPIVDHIADLPYLYPPDAEAAWRFGEKLRHLGRLLEDVGAHPSDAIDAAHDILAGEDRGPDRLGIRVEWPHFDYEADRQAIRDLLKEVVKMPWAVPRPKIETPTLRGLVTGEEKAIIEYRPIRMLPTVAQRDRRPLLNMLRLYLERHARRDRFGQTYARFVVVTAGPRVPYGGDLQGEMRKLSRKISKWRQISTEEHGVDLVFRGLEFTLNDDGAHPHANLVVEPRGWLGEDGWDEYLAAMHGHFGAWVHDNGRVDDAREIVKYVVKPGDLDKQILDLEDDGERLARTEWLYRALYRTRLAAFYGDAKDHWADVQRRGVRLGVVGERVREIPKYKGGEPSKTRDKSGENVIVCFGLASRVHTPWAEPNVLVLGYTETPTTEVGRQRLKAIQEQAEQALAHWKANGAPEPAVAVNIARAWRAADDDKEAGKIRALGASAASAQGLSTSTPQRGDGACAGGAVGGAYIVHTARLTVHGDPASGPPIIDTGPSPPPPDPDTIIFRSGRQIKSGYEIDPETGRRLGVAGHVRKPPEMRLADAPIWALDDPAVADVAWMEPNASITDSGTVYDAETGEVIGSLSRAAMKRARDWLAEVRKCQPASRPGTGVAA